MSHVRTQIRTAVTALLPSDEATVLTARILPLEQADLPAFLVYTGSERIQRGGFEALDRVVEVAIECLAKGADVDDQLDALLALAEAAVSGQTLGGRAVPMIPSKIEFDVSADGSVPIGRARLTYEVIYRTSLTDPETRI